MIEAQVLPEKTEDQLDREVATKTYTVISADLKSSLKLRAEILQNYDITVDTGHESNTEIWAIVEEIKKTLNDFLGWDLASLASLNWDMKNEIASLALKYEETELSRHENRVRDRYYRLPAIEKIRINLIKIRDLKIGNYSRPIFDLKFQSNDPETLLPIEYSMVVTRGCLDEVIHSSEPKTFKVLRDLCERFFSEADLHLSNFDESLEIQKREMKEKSKRENSQLKFSIIANQDKSDGDIEDED